MKNESKPIDEQAFDTLLAETLGGLNPPDLSGVVMDRLESGRDTPVFEETGSGFSIETTAKIERSESRVGKYLQKLGMVAAVAATLLWLFSNRSHDDAATETRIAHDPVATETIEVVKTVPEKREKPNRTQLNPERPLRGIPLLVDDDIDESQRNPSRERGVENSVAVVMPEVRIVSSNLNEELTEYWDAVGVEPTAEVPLDVAAERLFSRFDLEIPAELIIEPERLRSYLAKRSSAKPLATAWLRQMTNGGSRRLSDGDLLGLADELAQCIEGERSLDRTLLSWIEGQNPRSAAFHQAIGSVGRASTVNHLAKLTMNVDLRCIRCHDSKIEGTGKQADYWSFAALLKVSSATQSAAQALVTTKIDPSKPLFYELLDGRQRVADPLVSGHWLGVADGQPIRSVKEWADALSGSKSLADGVVNSIWELVFGMPLDGRVVDPVTAPHDAILEGIQDRLATDLMVSDFNIARLLALVMSTPVSRRAVPDAFNDDGQLLASSASRAEAIQAVNAFAASAPIKKRLSVTQRVDQVTRAMGTTINSANPSFVAQANDSTGTPAKSNRNVTATLLSDDFPIASDTLPVQWLRLIKSQDSQVDHLAYLADLPELPKEVANVVRMMEQGTVEDQNLLLQRVWWMLKP